MSYTDVERILLNLKIIGMLRQHEKFSTQNNTVIVDSNTYFQGIFRWMRGEKRTLNLEFLREVFNSAFAFLDSKVSVANGVPAVASVTNMLTNMPEVQPITSRHAQSDCMLFVQMLKELKQACAGIQNLQTTYERDSLVVAQLQIMLDSIYRRIKIYQTFTQESPLQEPSSDVYTAVNRVLDV